MKILKMTSVNWRTSAHAFAFATPSRFAERILAIYLLNCGNPNCFFYRAENCSSNDSQIALLSGGGADRLSHNDGHLSHLNPVSSSLRAVHRH